LRAEVEASVRSSLVQLAEVQAPSSSVEVSPAAAVKPTVSATACWCMHVYRFTVSVNATVSTQRSLSLSCVLAGYIKLRLQLNCSSEFDKTMWTCSSDITSLSAWILTRKTRNLTNILSWCPHCAQSVLQVDAAVPVAKAATAAAAPAPAPAAVVPHKAATPTTATTAASSTTTAATAAINSVAHRLESMLSSERRKSILGGASTSSNGNTRGAEAVALAERCALLAPGLSLEQEVTFF
jgi:hypothetical protein